MISLAISSRSERKQLFRRGQIARLDLLENLRNAAHGDIKNTADACANPSSGDARPCDRSSGPGLNSWGHVDILHPLELHPLEVGE